MPSPYGCDDPLKNFFDQPVLLIYRYRAIDGSTRWNCMTHGAWTWYYKDLGHRGVIHEFGTHGSLTSAVAYRMDRMSMVFLPATNQSKKLLIEMGSTSGYQVDKMKRIEKHLVETDSHYIHKSYPTWCLNPLQDTYRMVKHPDGTDLCITLVSEFISSHNGYPRNRIFDERRVFFGMSKKLL